MSTTIMETMTLTSNTEFNNYVTQVSYPLEIAPWCLYSTQELRRGAYETLTFFRDFRNNEKRTRTNLYLPGMLPNPCGFLVETVKIFGLGSEMAFTVFELIIGNKIWLQHPSWLTGIRPGLRAEPNLFIPPLMHFEARLNWDGPAELGIGANGHKRLKAQIQVALLGRMARALN